MDMVQENPRFIDFIEQNYQFHIGRMKLLEHIFSEMGECRKENVRRDIYLYGSMIQGQDLMARQMFLWLLWLLEEKEKIAVG